MDRTGPASTAARRDREIRQDRGRTALAECTDMRRALLAFALLATDCTRYAFAPVTPPSTTVSVFGRAAAYYSVPAAEPHGDLRVVSYGVEKLDSDAASIATLHVRVVATNTGSKRWTFDTREQRVDLDGHGNEPPLFATSDREGDGSVPPIVNLDFGAQRIVDLFYPLPAGMDEAKEIPAFRALTLVHTDDGDVRESTPFARIEVSAFSAYGRDASVASNAYDPDLDGYAYWDEPFFTNDGYVGFGGARAPREWGGVVRAHAAVSSGSSSSSHGRGSASNARTRVRSSGGGGGHSRGGGGGRRR